MPNPTDANNYVTSKIPVAKDTQKPVYPKWLYNPTLPAVVVVDWAQESALLNLGIGWQSSPANFPPPNVQFQSYANDAQAAAAGIPLGGQYLNGNFMMTRIS